MRTRKPQLVLVGCLLAVFIVWILWPAGKARDDDRRFRQMIRSADWGWRLRSAEKHFPGPLVRLLHIANLRSRYTDKAQAQEQALLASGYLTNTSVTITNLPVTAADEKSCLAEVQRRLRARVRIDFLSFHMQNNQAVITCRPRDLALVRTAIENP